MADANFYDDTSLPAEKKTDDNEYSEGKRGKLSSILIIWVGGILILYSFIDLIYLSHPGRNFHITIDLAIAGYGVMLFIILLTTLKDLAREIRKLFIKI